MTDALDAAWATFRDELRRSLLNELRQELRPQAPRLLTVAEACEALHVSRGTLAALMKRGDLRYAKAGRRILIAETALAELERLKP